MLQVNFTSLCFIEPELSPIEFLQRRNFDLLRFVTLTVHMTFIYERDSYRLEMYRMNENELRTAVFLKVIVLQIHTERLSDIRYRNFVPDGFAGSQLVVVAAKTTTTTTTHWIVALTDSRTHV